MLIAASVANFAINIDFFAVQATLPPMARDLDTTVTDLQWVISGYMLALASCLIVGGRLADLLGRRTFLIIGTAIFGVASLAAGLSATAEMVILMRIVQGVGAAILFPVALAVVTNAFPPEKTQRAVGLVFALAAVGQALGPLVGGALTELLSWRWVFFVNVPVAGAVIVLTLLSIDESRDETVPRTIDWPGLVLIVGSIATFTYGIDRASDWGWTAPATRGLVTTGSVGLVAFVLVESRAAAPLLDLALFKIRVFSLMITAGAIGNVAAVVTIFLSMIFLQDVEGFTTLEAGTAFLAFSLAMTAVNQFAGRLERFPAWAVMTVALLVGGLGTIGMGLVDTLALFMFSSAFSGAGLGLCWAFASVVTQAAVPQQKAGEASGTVLTMLIGCGGVAIAVAASLIDTATDTAAQLGDSLDALLVGFGLLAIAYAPMVVVLGRSRHTTPESVPC